MLDMIVYEISIKFSSDDIDGIDFLKTNLISSGIKEENIIEFIKNNSVYLTLYEKTLSKIKSFKSKLIEWGIKKNVVSVRMMKEVEWVDVWKDSFKPFKLTEKLKIIPIV